MTTPIDTEGPLWDAVVPLLDEGNTIDDIAQMVQDIDDARKALLAEEPQGSVDWNSHVESRLLQLEIVLSTVKILMEKLDTKVSSLELRGQPIGGTGGIGTTPPFMPSVRPTPWLQQQNDRYRCSCQPHNGGSGICMCVRPGDSIRC